MIQKGEKIVVGMSGGVDSSMALVLLKRKGWSPIGVSLKLPVWKSKENLLRENICCTEESLAVAKSICQKLNVPYYIFDVKKEFQKEVIDYFVSESKVYKTPNPCVVCNRCLKFKKLFEFAKKKGAKYIATGHYARLLKNEKTGKYELLKARDKSKDQTYNLCLLPQNWLKYLVFPLGDYTKTEIYKMAKKEGFDIFLKRKESQNFCFVAGKSLSSFLKEKIGVKPGKIMDTKGNVLGKHQGLHFYTIGQRKGLGLSGGPWFVMDFGIEKNILVVAKNLQEGAKKELVLSSFHFMSGELPKKKIKVMAKIRYQQFLAKATLFPATKNGLKLVFEKPQKAVTPGQFAVFYLPSEALANGGKGEVCLGGGRIL